MTCQTCKVNVISMSRGQYCKYGVPGYPDVIICAHNDIETSPDKIRDIISRCNQIISEYQAVIKTCEEILRKL